jgi:sodium-dependent dicarboxylate transporter 2/3/5
MSTPPVRLKRLPAMVGLFGGLALFGALMASAPPAGLGAAGWSVLCVALLMTAFWFTEAIPVTLTAVLPFVVFPLLGVQTSAEVAGSYFSPVLFLVLGGFFLALAMEKWGLHRRIALMALGRARGGAGAILLAVMASTALVSGFVTNSAATLAMLPVALAIVAAAEQTGGGTEQAAEHRRFGQAMVLGVAYGSTMGGFTTIIGSPGNAAAVAIFERVYDETISFNTWSAFGVPLALLGLPLAWLILARVAFPFRLKGLDMPSIRAAVGDPGPWTTPDVRLVVILIATLAAWIGMPLIQRVAPAMSEAHAAILAAIAVFVIPAGGKGERASAPLLDWSETKQAPWSLLILVGGGLALAEGINATDLSDWMQTQFAVVGSLPLAWQIVALAAVTLMVTEFVTNTATIAAFLPATVALAGAGQDPLILGMTVALAANWGFVMPVGTPSLAIAYGTGRFSVPQMAWAGLWMDVAGIALILAVVFGVGSLI